MLAPANQRVPSLEGGTDSWYVTQPRGRGVGLVAEGQADERPVRHDLTISVRRGTARTRYVLEQAALPADPRSKAQLNAEGRRWHWGHTALFDFTFNQLGAGYRPGERVPHACQNGRGTAGNHGAKRQRTEGWRSSRFGRPEVRMISR